MKYRYTRNIMIMLLSVFWLITNEVWALSNTGFSTEELSKKDSETFLDNVNISIFTEEPEKKTIECFDVNKNGMIALGHSNFDNKTICVYTNDGTFKYGYIFKCSGTFGIEWDEDNVILLFVRSDVAVTLDYKGEVISVRKIKNTIENDSYWNTSVFSTKRFVENVQYEIKNNMGLFNIFSSSYSQLIATNANGETEIIYDVNQKQTINTIAIVLSCLIFVGIILFIVMQQSQNKIDKI